MKLNQFRVKPRLIGTFLVISIITIIVGFKGLSGVTTALGLQEEIGKTVVPATESAVTEQTAAAAQEMSASSSEVRQQIEQLAAVSQQNSASTQEMTASAERLAQMARSLEGLVSLFKLEDMAVETEQHTTSQNHLKKAA